MLVENDKIEMINAIDGFNKVGDKFEIVNVTDNGSIIFRSSYGQGVMTQDEFDKYFVKVKERVWSKWVDSGKGYEFKTDNEKYVKVHKDGFHAKASCNPNDKFNLSDGIDLCLARITIKKLSKLS